MTSSTELAVHPRRCTKRRTDGEPCTRWAIKGGDMCPSHGGSAPQVKAKAAERQLRAQLQTEVRKMGWEPVTNPALLLADVAGEMVAFKDLAREQMNDLRSWENQNAMGTEDVKARVGVYAQALRDVAGVADKMWGRGIDSAMLRREIDRPSVEAAAAFQRVMQRVVAQIAPDVAQGEAQAAVVAAMQAEGLL